MNHPPDHVKRRKDSDGTTKRGWGRWWWYKEGGSRKSKGDFIYRFTFLSFLFFLFFF
jgi:hypothetical protein